MKIDLYTKTILTIIAVCLTIIILQTLPLFPKAMAFDTIRCIGNLKVLAHSESAIIHPGGYGVDIRCR